MSGVYLLFLVCKNLSYSWNHQDNWNDAERELERDLGNENDVNGKLLGLDGQDEERDENEKQAAGLMSYLQKVYQHGSPFGFKVLFYPRWKGIGDRRDRHSRYYVRQWKRNESRGCECQDYPNYPAQDALQKDSVGQNDWNGTFLLQLVVLLNLERDDLRDALRYRFEWYKLQLVQQTNGGRLGITNIIHDRLYLHKLAHNSHNVRN